MPMKSSPTHVANKNGLYDVLPEHIGEWDEVRGIIEKELQKKSFHKIHLAPFESKDLFSEDLLEALKVKSNDELVTVEIQNKAMVANAPGPVSLIRAALEHKLVGSNMPLRLYSVCDLIQEDDRKNILIKSEIIGDTEPVRDAESILSAYQVLQSLGYENLVVQVNSVGTSECRVKYLDVVSEAVGDRYRNVMEAYRHDPIELFTYLTELDKEYQIEIPQLIDHLSDTCQDNFRVILEFLDVLDIPYLFNPSLKASKGHFDQTYFEVFSQDYPDKVLVRGGRHDRVAKALSNGVAVEGAVGMDFDIGNILSTYKKTQEEVYQKPSVFIASIGLESQKSALKVLSMMHDEAIPVHEAFYEPSLRTQLQMARDKEVKLILIIGKKEAIEDSVILRDRLSDNQETVSMDKFLFVLKQRLFEEAD